MTQFLKSKNRVTQPRNYGVLEELTFYNRGNESTKPAGRIRILVETIEDYWSKHSPEMIQRKPGWFSRGCRRGEFGAPTRSGCTQQIPAAKRVGRNGQLRQPCSKWNSS